MCFVTVGVNADHLAGSVFNRFLHCEAALFPPFHTVLFGKKPLCTAHTLGVGCFVPATCSTQTIHIDCLEFICVGYLSLLCTPHLFIYLLTANSPSHLFLKYFYLFVFRVRGREGEREVDQHQCVRDTGIGCLMHSLNRGPGLQPRRVSWLESNQWRFGLQAGPQATEPHQPELFCALIYISIIHIYFLGQLF